MKTVSISGSSRSNVGKKDAKALRNAKLVPCVLYGGKEQIHFAVPEADFKKLIFTPDVFIVDVDVEGKKYSTILQETQYHKITDRLIHADFLEIIPGKPITVDLPVRTSGTSPGVRNGGRLLKKMKTVRVKGLVEKMPEDITISIDKLQIGNAVRIEHVKIDGLTLVSAPKNTIVSVATTRVASAPVAGGAVAEGVAEAEAPAEEAAPAEA